MCYRYNLGWNFCLKKYPQQTNQHGSLGALGSLHYPTVLSVFQGLTLGYSSWAGFASKVTSVKTYSN